jgi:hypothetical protein
MSCVQELNVKHWLYFVQLRADLQEKISPEVLFFFACAEPAFGRDLAEGGQN